MPIAVAQDVRALRVLDIMSSPVVTLNRDHSIHLAASLMRLRHIRHLPVVDDNDHFVGLVTHRDLLAAQAEVLARASTSQELSVPVARVMKMGVWTVHEGTAALEAARIMFDHKFGCLPVLSGKKLVGIVTGADFLGAYLTRLEQRRDREDTNPRIRKEELNR
jgi:CBS domain-containing membrane protein